MRESHPTSSALVALLVLAFGMPAHLQAQEKKTPADAAKTFTPRTLDLMSIIDPDRDPPVKGKWVMSERKLLCQDQHFVPRVQIHYEPPEEYDFTIKFQQEKLRHAVTLMMPNRNGDTFVWKVGVQSGNNFEIISKSGKWKGKATSIIKANTIHTTTVQVRRDSVRCLLDGKVLIEGPTDFKDLTTDGWHKMPDTGLLGIGCDDPTVFHTIWLKEISGPGRPREPETAKKK